MSRCQASNRPYLITIGEVKTGHDTSVSVGPSQHVRDADEILESICLISQNARRAISLVVVVVDEDQTSFVRQIRPAGSEIVEVFEVSVVGSSNGVRYIGTVLEISDPTAGKVVGSLDGFSTAVDDFLDDEGTLV